MTREVFQLDNLHCPSCVARIERTVGGLPGVRAAKLAFAAGRLTVEYDEASTSSQAIAGAAGRLGYPARSLRREEVK
jgi:copper chaperone CopZ